MTRENGTGGRGKAKQHAVEEQKQNEKLTNNWEFFRRYCRSLFS